MIACFALPRVSAAIARFLCFGGISARPAREMPCWACKRVKRGIGGLLTISGLLLLTIGGLIVNLYEWIMVDNLPSTKTLYHPIFLSSYV